MLSQNHGIRFPHDFVNLQSPLSNVPAELTNVALRETWSKQRGRSQVEREAQSVFDRGELCRRDIPQ